VRGQPRVAAGPPDLRAPPPPRTARHSSLRQGCSHLPPSDSHNSFRNPLSLREAVDHRGQDLRRPRQLGQRHELARCGARTRMSLARTRKPARRAGRGKAARSRREWWRERCRPVPGGTRRSPIRRHQHSSVEAQRRHFHADVVRREPRARLLRAGSRSAARLARERTPLDGELAEPGNDVLRLAAGDQPHIERGVRWAEQRIRVGPSSSPMRSISRSTRPAARIADAPSPGRRCASRRAP